MNTVEVACSYCGEPTLKSTSHFNRARALGAKLFCNKRCDGLSRRVPTTPEQRKAAKAAYDERYREVNRERLLRKAKDYYAVYGPSHREEERARRQETMPRHVEYCRRPDYREKKQKYDAKLRASEYGEFAEAYRILIDLHREIIARVPDKYERLKARGYFERQQAKRRTYA